MGMANECWGLWNVGAPSVELPRGTGWAIDGDDSVAANTAGFFWAIHKGDDLVPLSFPTAHAARSFRRAHAAFGAGWVPMRIPPQRRYAFFCDPRPDAHLDPVARFLLHGSNPEAMCRRQLRIARDRNGLQGRLT